MLKLCLSLFTNINKCIIVIFLLLGILSNGCSDNEYEKQHVEPVWQELFIVEECPYSYEGVADKVRVYAQQFYLSSFDEAIEKHQHEGIIRSYSGHNDLFIELEDYNLHYKRREYLDSHKIVYYSKHSKVDKNKYIAFNYRPEDGSLSRASGDLPDSKGWGSVQYYPSGNLKSLGRIESEEEHKVVGFSIHFSEDGEKRIFTRTITKTGLEPAGNAEKTKQLIKELEELFRVEGVN